MKKHLIVAFATIVAGQAFAAKVSINNISGRGIEVQYYGPNLWGDKKWSGKTVIVNNTVEDLVNELRPIDKIEIYNGETRKQYNINTPRLSRQYYTYKGPDQLVMTREIKP